MLGSEGNSGNVPAVPTVSAGPRSDDLRDVLLAWSRYFDGFLSNRSVVHATLFPEKPRQMWFGYEYALPELTFLAERIGETTTPESFGASQRRMLAEPSALHFTSAIWSTCFGAIGTLLEGDEIDVERVRASLDFWTRANDAYFGGEARSDAHRILEDEELAVVTESLVPAPGRDVQRTLAALQSYSWLLEAESRQGASAHGPYTVEGRTIVVREFGDLSGSYYPWVDASLMADFVGPLAVVVELEDVDVTIDAFGTTRFTPDSYGESLTRVGVIGPHGPIDDPLAVLARLRVASKGAQLALYGDVLDWTAQQRFIAGVSSYARMWECFAQAADLDAASREHVRASLQTAIDERLAGHLAEDGVGAVWEWARDPARPTFLTPMIDQLFTDDSRRERHG